jgi:penicillin amidase
VEIAFTRYGPVLKIERERRRAFALRTVWTEPGTSSYFGAARYQTAADWAAFKAALAHWGAASMNFAYADVGGNIGWATAGFIPRRRNWDGLIPVPGDGRYEWDGFLAHDELPSLYNPAKGYLATANEMNLPPDYPAEARKISFEWADPARAHRIEQVLAANDRMTVADSAALQMDVVSLTALRAVRLLDGLSSDDPKVAVALRLLRSWDGRESEASAAGAIAEVWMSRHLAPRTIAALTPATVAEAQGAGAPNAVITHLEAPDGALPTLTQAQRADLLLESLAAALAEIEARLGPDMAGWRWGDLHQAHLQPSAAALADPALKEKLVHGPRPVRGSATTPCAATYPPESYSPNVGASFRMVVDVGAWDNSLVINTPGQSGDPSSPHYSDLFERWAEGEFVPMLYSREAVEAATEQVIQLRPA